MAYFLGAGGRGRRRGKGSIPIFFLIESNYTNNNVLKDKHAKKYPFQIRQFLIVTFLTGAIKGIRGNY